jgi:hypothetical protein
VVLLAGRRRMIERGEGIAEEKEEKEEKEI